MNLVLVLVSFQIVYEFFFCPIFLFLLLEACAGCRLSLQMLDDIALQSLGSARGRVEAEEGKGAGGGDDLMDGYRL